jgi:hypothetical protein
MAIRSNFFEPKAKSDRQFTRQFRFVCLGKHLALIARAARANRCSRAEVLRRLLERLPASDYIVPPP